MTFPRLPEGNVSKSCWSARLLPARLPSGHPLSVRLLSCMCEALVRHDRGDARYQRPLSGFYPTKNIS